MTSFPAAFVQGVFSGMDWREGREDRKRRRAIEDEQLGWDREDREYTKEEREFQRKERSRAQAERDRAEAERNAELAAWNETVDGMLGKGPKGDTAPATPRTASEMPAPSGTPLSFGVLPASPATPASVAPAQTDSQPRNVQTVAPSGMAPPGMEAAPVVPGAEGSPGRPGASAAVPMPEEDRPLRPRESGDSDPPSRREMSIMDQAVEAELANRRAKAAQPAAKAPASERPLTTSVQDEIRAEERQRIRRDMGPAGVSTDPYSPGVGGLPSASPQERVNAESPVQSSPTGPNTGPGARVSPGPSAEMRPIGAETAPAAQRSAPAMAGPAAADAAPGAAESAPPLPKTAQGTPVVSAVAAARTAPPQSAGRRGADRLSFGVIGKDMPVKATKAQRQRATEAGVKFYQDAAMPPIVEHYLRTGQIEKAQAFEKFVADQRTQKGMRSWMGAVHSLNIGDSDGFVDGIVGAYNSYYDDGFTALKEESEFRKDSEGNLVSARIAFRKDESGEVFYEEFATTGDVLKVVLGKLSPEGAFDELYAKMQPDGGEAAQKKAEAVLKAAEMMAKTNLEFAQLPLAQQMEMARQFVESGSLGAGTPASSAITDADIED